MQAKSKTYGMRRTTEYITQLGGINIADQIVAVGTEECSVSDDACVLYPNPYMVVTKTGYTKHYYAGTERLATVIGGGGLGEIVNPVDGLHSQHDLDIISFFNSRYSDYDPFEHENNLSEPIGTVGIDGTPNPRLDYTCSSIVLTDLDVLTHQNILLEAIELNAPTMTLEQNVYFYHGDHLGSANWITDVKGNPIQYIHYAPYGELIANQQPIGYDERFKFTGKERDWETGYGYFGARFYDYRKGFWNSVDPLADKYPNVTPYLYCNGNPIMLVDPNGRAAYYTNMGAYLGTDKDGFTGNVYISTAEDFEYLKDMSNVSAGISTMPLQIADLSSEAYSNIYTDILTRSGFDIARTLLNGKISVINGTDLYNNPECNRQSTLANATTTISSKDGKVVNVSYRITANQNNALFKRTCGTIEGIISVLGVHEFIGHIMKGYGDASGTHCIIYALQMIDASWEKLPLEYQNTIRKNFQIYYTKEILNVIFGK